MQKLPGGKYKVQLRVGGRIISHTFSNKRDAEKKEADLKRAQELIRAGMEAPRDSVLFFDYAGAWLRRREKEYPLSTFAMDESRVRNYLIEPLGALPLPMISSKVVRELLDGIQETHKLTNATRNRIRALLHTMFQDAFMDEKVIFNAVSRVPLLPEKRVSVPPLSHDQAKSLLAAAAARGPMEALLIAAMTFAGRRVSEAVALQNHDFDLARNELHVRRLYEQESGQVFERIKGRDEGIVLPLFEIVRDAFRAHHKVSPFKAPADFCIHTQTGQPMSTYAARRLVHELSKEAKVPDVSPHVLRATFATLAEEAGFSKEDVQRMLGHSTVLVTQRYTRRGAQPLVEKGEKLGFGQSEGEE